MDSGSRGDGSFGRLDPRGTAKEPSATRNRRRAGWLLVALLVVTAGLYARTLGYGFLEYDDPQRVRDNPIVREGLTVAGVRWAWTTTAHAPYWHPLSWLSHMLDVSLYGLEPRGHHLTNLLIHLGTVSVLYWLLWTVTGSIGRSLFVAGLFALHPIQSGTVVWISARPDLLGTFFALLALAFYGREAGGGRWRRWILIGSSFVLALLGKPTVLTVPLLMLLMDDWPLRRFETAPRASASLVGRAGGLVLEKLPWMALAAASAATVLLDKENVGGVAASQQVAWTLRLGNAAVSYVRYLAKAVVPVGFSIHHPHPDLPGGRPWAGWEIAGAALLLVVLTAAVVRARRGYLRFGVIWYAVALLPVIGVLQVGNQAMAERYAYFSLIGPFVAVSWGCRELIDRWIPSERARRNLLRASAVAVLGLLAAGTSREIASWRDSIRLFERGLAAYPDDPVLHYNLGVALERAGREPDAETHYRRAVEIQPANAAALNNLGNVLYRRGLVGEAEVSFRRALRVDPSFALARSNLGGLLVATSRYDEAIRELRSLVATAPDLTAARLNLGRALGGVGRHAEAEAEYRTVLRNDPGSAEASHGLALSLVGQDRWSEARGALESAVRLRPDWPTALGDLAWLLIADPASDRAADPRRAVELAGRAVRLTAGGNPRLLQILAEARARAGESAVVPGAAGPSTRPPAQRSTSTGRPDPPGS